MSVSFEQIIPIFRIFDVAKAKEFYIDFLGFSLNFEHRFEGVSPVYMEVERAGFRLHLSEHHGDACPGANVYVRMTGVLEFHAELAARNYGYLKPGVETMEWNARVLEVIDPFGNRIRFAEEVNS